MKGTCCVFLVLVTLLGAQGAFPNPITDSTRIHNIGSSNIITIATYNSICSSYFFTLNSSSSSCLGWMDFQGNVVNSSCPTPSNDLFCIQTYGCYSLSTSSRTINVLNLNGSVTRAFGDTVLINPVKFVGFRTGNFINFFVVDGLLNSTITQMNYQFQGTGFGNPPSNATVARFQNSQPVASIFAHDASSFWIAFKNNDTIFRINSAGTVVDSISKNFTSVQAFARDTLGRFIVSDAGCNCIKVTDSSGNWTRTITGAVNPTVIQTTRNNILVLDSLGITRYDEPLTITSLRTTNATCRNGGFMVNITGGVAPYTYRLYPEFSGSSSNNQYYTSSSIPVRNTLIAPYYVYNDMVSLDWTDMYTGTIGKRVPQADSSYVAPFSGKFSYGMQMVSRVRYGFRAIAFIATTTFSKVELMVNPMEGDKSFLIDLGSAMQFYYYPENLTANTWNKISINIAESGITSYSTIYITDLSNSTCPNATANCNMIYVDDVVLLPYPDERRRIAVTDTCLAVQYTDYFVIKDDDALKVQMQSTPTSCGVGGVDGSKSADGVVTAVATGGVPPYTYAWSFSEENTSYVGDLGPFNNIQVIYDNGVQDPFYDTDSDMVGRIMLDSSRYRSAPHSFSMAPTTNTQTFILNSGETFNSSKISGVEFYVNGGPVGQQMINVQLWRNYQAVGTAYLIHRLMGIPSIPPNTWVRVVLPITATQFTGIMFSGNAVWNQPRIYIDDVSFLGNSYTVTVTDSNNCAVLSYVNLTSPDLVRAEKKVENTKCYGSTDGKAAVNVLGGTPPYIYNWDGAVSSIPNVTGLPQSTVSVVVTDAHGCVTRSVSVDIDVLQPPPLQINYQVQHAKCHGTPGTITANAEGGVSPFSYTWSSTAGIDFTEPEQPLPLVIFEDEFENWFELGFNTPHSDVQLLSTGAKGTELPSEFQIRTGYSSIYAQANLTLDYHYGPPSGPGGQPTPPPGLGLFVLSVGCPGCIDLTRYTGVQMWVKLATPSDALNLSVVLLKTGLRASSTMPMYAPGSYPNSSDWHKVYVGFTGTLTAIVDQLIIFTNEAATDAIWLDDVVLMPKTGGASLVVGRGVNSGYNSIISAPAGQYIISVEDKYACPVTRTVTITQPTPLNITNTTDTSSGTISLEVNGGSPPYTYTWVGRNDTTASLTGLPAGYYKVDVTDANGCMASPTFTMPAAIQKSKSNVAETAGIGAGVGVFVLAAAAAAVFFVVRQRRQVVRVLSEVEEGERRAYKIDFSSLEINMLIGAGSFGEVFRGEYKGADVAVKKLKTQQMTKQQVDEFAKESAVMVGLRHPNILLFMGVCLEPANLCIVTELCPRGNLSEVLRDRDIQLPTQIIFKMALDTLKGLQFIHSSGFVHRDLKSPNLLVDRYWSIKIADFGLSVAKHNANDDAQVSLLWTAPEILMREPGCYSYASDMYSFGIILWELVSKKTPWEDVAPAAITSKVVSGQRPNIPQEWDEPVKKLIMASWAQFASARPTVKQARSMLETEVIPIVGELDLGSTSDSSFFKTRSADSLSVPPPQAPFALVSTVLVGASKLWETDPRGMSEAVKGMVDIFQRIARKFYGYEVTNYPSFQYAFATSSNAINFCLQAQIAMLHYDYPKSLLQIPEAKEERQNGELIYRGFRIRMGVHWANPVLRSDPQSGKVNYVGPSMLLGPAIAKRAPSGTTLIDQEMYNRVMSTNSTLEVDPFAINPLGEVYCNNTPVRLFKIVPATCQELLLAETTPGEQEDESEEWLANFEDIKLQTVIGHGSFGEVYSATWMGHSVAAKKFVQQKVTGQLMLEMRTECAILRTLNHPNILKFVAMCLQSPNLCLLTELMDRGSLANVLGSTMEISWPRKIGFVRDIAQGMAFLHKNEIIHRDIKSSNLLVALDWQVKIGDFGFSRIRAANQTMTQCGTVAWTAPEIFDGSHYTEKADVFSFAVVLWELIFRKKPWAGKHSMKVISAVEGGGRLPITDMPSDVPHVIVALLRECWAQAPDDRPSFTQILERVKDA